MSRPLDHGLFGEDSVERMLLWCRGVVSSLRAKVYLASLVSNN